MGLSTSPASVPSVTEREAVLRERKAFERGYRTWRYDGPGCAPRIGAIALRDGEAELLASAVEAEYPLPKITRPRVVLDPIDPNYAWRFVNGALQCERGGSGVWGNTMTWALHPERVRVLADLVANPTETVEDESSALDHPHERLGDER